MVNTTFCVTKFFILFYLFIYLFYFILFFFFVYIKRVPAKGKKIMYKKKVCIFFLSHLQFNYYSSFILSTLLLYLYCIKTLLTPLIKRNRKKNDEV